MLVCLKGYRLWSKNFLQSQTHTNPQGESASLEDCGVLEQRAPPRSLSSICQDPCVGAGYVCEWFKIIEIQIHLNELKSPDVGP